MYLADLFLIKKDANIANYADDTTTCTLQNDIDTVIKKDANIANYADDTDRDSVIKNLETDSAKMFQWYVNNSTKANPCKYHLQNLSSSAKIDGNVINKENNVKLLVITFDNDLSFNKHVSLLCNKATQKLYALSRISDYISLEKRRLLMKTFIE